MRVIHVYGQLQGDHGFAHSSIIKPAPGVLRPSSLQPLHRFTYVTAHSPTLPPLYLRHSSFYSPSAALPTS